MAGTFAVMIAFTDPLASSDTGVRFGSILFALVFTLLVLMYKIREKIVNAQIGRAVWAIVTLLSFIIISVISLASSGLHDQNSGNPTELIEIYIALGIAIYALELTWRTFSRKGQTITDTDRIGPI
jgi:hypothetical protein